MAPIGHDVPRLRPCLVIGLLLLFVSQLTQAQCFFNPTSYTVGVRPQSVVVADLTGDGQDDVITANQLSGNVAVLPGQAGGGLGSPLYYNMDDAPYAVAVADLNKDNLPDLITINVDGGYITVRLALPGGIFGLTTNYSLGASPVSIAVADINYDGQLDIITANASSNSVTVLPGVPLPAGLAFVNFDAPVSYAVGQRPASVKVADVTGDGMLDIITANTDSDNVSVLRRLITRTFAPAEQFPAGDAPTDVVIAKVDGDPFYDMVVSNFYDQTVSVLLAERLGDFARPVSYRVGIWPTAVVVADVTNDGQADIITNSTFSNTVSVLPGRSGGFRPSVSYAVGNLPDALAVADITKDGRPDIISVNKSSNDITVLPGQAPGVITQQPASSSTVAPGANVRVSVGISGTTTSLQWYNQAGVVSGQTSATLTLNGVTPDQTGSYALVATSPCNSVTSTAFTLTVQPPPSIRYVKVGGIGDGSSWVAASGDLQAMLNAAGVEQVRVAAGLYKPTKTADQSISFVIPDGVQVYGGYVAGTDTRSTNPSSTTLSGDIDGDNTLAGNTYKVVQTSGRNVVLDGLLITQGDARPLTGLAAAGGGGLFVNTSRASLTLRAVQFINNAARNGGGMFVDRSASDVPTSVTLINCSFSQNITTTMNGLGAGLYLRYASGTLTNCSFNGNVASFGGALFTDNSNPTLTNCIFNGNTATSGGGIYNNFSNPMLTNCSFVGNSASGLGGGMVNADSSPTLTNCSFSGNGARNEGGGAILNAGANLRSDLVLINCIIWGQPVQAVVNNGASSTTYRYTDSQDRVQPGEGNRSVDPLFVDAPNGNLQLTACSPLIDAGDNSVDVGETDLVGNNRRQRTIDMGAFEFQGTSDPSGTVAITQQLPSSFAICAGASVTTVIRTSGTVSTYQWYKDGNPLSGQTSTGLTLTNITMADMGSYVVVVTGSCNSVTSTAFNLTVNPNPAVSLTASGPLTCAQTSVSLTASGQGSFAFAGPRGPLASTGNRALVSESGTYSVTLTTTSGCVNSATTTVAGSTAAPTNLSLTVSNTLSCSQPTATLTATADSDAPPLTYQFGSASGSLPSAGNQVTARNAGVYSVTATAANGCFSSMTAEVIGGTALPSASLTNDGPLSCAQPQVTLTASASAVSAGASLTYVFGGPRGPLANATPTSALVSEPGVYSVVVTSVGGCSVTATTTVSSSTASPTNVMLTNNGPLSCNQTSVTLTATSTDSQTYAFSGPRGLIQSGVSPTLTVTEPGTYSVVVQGATGCPATAVTTVESTTAVPTLSISPGSSTLTCASPTVELTASEGSTYQWSGPDGFASMARSITVTRAGTYSVTLSSGGSCSATAQTTVSSSTALPGLSITASPALTITPGQAATLTAQPDSGADPVSLRWSTGSTDPSVTVDVAGPYSVTATASNGCSATASVTLTVAPVLSGPFAITGVATLGCTPILPNRFSISFNPQYQGLNGQPLSFSVTNELLPTTQPGPYTLQLYSDNPTITLEASQAGVATRYTYHWLQACNASTAPNTPPRLLTPIPGQTATVGQPLSYVIPAGTFTDEETPTSLRLSASGLPPGLSFSAGTLSGTPSTTLGSPFSITLTATDPGNLRVSANLILTVLPASGPPNPSQPFALTGVTTISCTPVADRISLSFAPRYAGLTGQPIAFQVVNESLPTTDPGPYSLTLYRDNPVITLRASQTGSAGPVTVAYNWLAGCSGLGQDNSPPLVNSPVSAQTAVVGQGYSLNLSNTFLDQETPNQLVLSASGLPAGLSLNGALLSGTPSQTGVSQVSLTATDGGGLSTGTSFLLTVVAEPSDPSDPPSTGVFRITGVSTVSCAVVSGGQRRVSFSPQYGGLDGSPVSFSVVNERGPTTEPGPYSLTLYTDNPVVTLSAGQGSVVATYVYNWLGACLSGSRVGAEEPGSGLRVVVLGNPVGGEQVEVEVRGAEGHVLRLDLTDLRGQVVSARVVGQAGAIERQGLSLGGSSAGVLLLRVSTPTQSQTLKLIKTH